MLKAALAECESIHERGSARRRLAVLPQRYPSQEAYLFAIAEAMRHEYEAVANAGIVLQRLPISPWAATSAVRRPQPRGLPQTRGMHVQALDHALVNRMRACICAGARRPASLRRALADIIDIVFAARPSAISFEAADPRHGHEWTLFEVAPVGKVLIPGVIESKSNFIEHPDRSARRALCAAGSGARRHRRQRLRLRHLGGTGRGDPDLIAAMAEGARIASRQFWN